MKAMSACGALSTVTFLCLISAIPEARTQTTCSKESGYLASTWCLPTEKYWTETLKEVTETKRTFCNTGKKQSPIALEAPLSSSPIGAIDFDYTGSPDPLTAKVKNSGHTVALPLDAMRVGLRIAKQRFGLKELHFHYPSEHVLKGERFALELHLVHEAGTGSQLRRAVVAVLIKLGSDNPALNTLFGDLSTKTKDSEGNVNITGDDLMSVLPADKSYLTYQGSLTTPFATGGCEENVTWLVLSTPIQASQAQITEFKSTISYSPELQANARPYANRGSENRGVQKWSEKASIADFRSATIATQNLIAIPGGGTKKSSYSEGYQIGVDGSKFGEPNLQIRFKSDASKKLVLTLNHASTEHSYKRFGLSPFKITMNSTVIRERYDVSEAKRSWGFFIDQFEIPVGSLRRGDNALRIDLHHRVFGKEPPHSPYLLQWLIIEEAQ